MEEEKTIWEMIDELLELAHKIQLEGEAIKANEERLMKEGLL